MDFHPKFPFRFQPHIYKRNNRTVTNADARNPFDDSDFFQQFAGVFSCKRLQTGFGNVVIVNEL